MRSIHPTPERGLLILAGTRRDADEGRGRVELPGELIKYRVNYSDADREFR